MDNFPSTHTKNTADIEQLLSVCLRKRVVRESSRHTWFVVNESKQALTTIPLELHDEAALRRVEVNGEWSSSEYADGHVLVHLPRELRTGSGIIIVLHLR